MGLDSDAGQELDDGDGEPCQADNDESEEAKDGNEDAEAGFSGGFRFVYMTFQ